MGQGLLGNELLSKSSIFGNAGAVINGLLQDYVVATGQTIIAGDFVSYVNNQNKGTSTAFRAASVYPYAAVALSDTAVMVIYNEGSNSTAVILTISGDTFTIGTPFVYSTGGDGYISAAKLSSTKVIVVYQAAANSSYGTAVVLSVSGTTITKGTALTFKSARSDYTTVVALSDTVAVVAFVDYGNNQYGTACVLSVSGTTITAGALLVFEGSASVTVTNIAAATLTATSVLLVYRRHFGSNPYGYCKVLTVSGTTLSAGAEYVYEGTYAPMPNVVSLSATLAVIAYTFPYSSNNYNLTRVRLLNISGTTVSAAGPEVSQDFGYSPGLGCYMYKLSSTEVLVVTSYNNFKIFTVKIYDNAMDVGSQMIISASQYVYQLACVALTDVKALMAFRDEGASGYGKAFTFNNVKQVKKSLASAIANGIAKTAGAAGVSISIYKPY